MAEPNRLNLQNLLTVISVVILVGTEVLAVAIAAGWAVAGLFDLGATVEYGFMAVFSVIALWAIYVFAKSAAQVEPLYPHD